MTNPIQLLTKIPFDGFYDSIYSAEIDRAEEYETETWEESSSWEDELKYPPELRIGGDEAARLFFDVTDYSAAYERVAGWYVAAFDQVAAEYAGLRLNLKFDSMSSPREYNFETDRLFAQIPLKTVQALFALSKADNHEALKSIIRRRFTSRSGFISFYETDLVEWLAKPVRDWDHNEIETLIMAAFVIKGQDIDSEEIRMALFEATMSDDLGYQAWSNAVDWAKFEEKREALRAEKLGDWRESDPEAAALYAGDSETGLLDVRCPLTLDLIEQAGLAQ